MDCLEYVQCDLWRLVDCRVFRWFPVIGILYYQPAINRGRQMWMWWTMISTKHRCFDVNYHWMMVTFVFKKRLLGREVPKLSQFYALISMRTQTYLCIIKLYIDFDLFIYIYVHTHIRYTCCIMLVIHLFNFIQSIHAYNIICLVIRLAPRWWAPTHAQDLATSEVWR